MPPSHPPPSPLLLVSIPVSLQAHSGSSVASLGKVTGSKNSGGRFLWLQTLFHRALLPAPEAPLSLPSCFSILFVLHSMTPALCCHLNSSRFLSAPPPPPRIPMSCGGTHERARQRAGTCERAKGLSAEQAQRVPSCFLCPNLSHFYWISGPVKNRHDIQSKAKKKKGVGCRPPATLAGVPPLELFWAAPGVPPPPFGTSVPGPWGAPPHCRTSLSKSESQCIWNRG